MKVFSASSRVPAEAGANRAATEAALLTAGGSGDLGAHAIPHRWDGEVQMTIRRISRAFAAASLVILAFAPRLRANPGDLFGYLPFSSVSPQDIAQDPADGTFWITNFLDNQIHHYSADLREELDVLPSPFGSNTFITGIAFNSRDDTLLVTEATAGAIREIRRDGSRTGRNIALPLEEVVNPLGGATARGLAFHAGGAGGQGSVYLVESLGTLIYEIALSGEILRYFPHPDDPDGFPGHGSSARATDIDLIFDDGELAGFYVTGNKGRQDRILRLDSDGGYTGISIPLTDSGGNVSGILRRSIEHPVSGEPVDAFICVVESNARFAILEGGEPEYREIFDVECLESGREVALEWTSPQTYDAIEILRACEVVEVLPGDATSWRSRLDVDGVHELSVRVLDNGSVMQTESCSVVIGPGQVLDARNLEADYPLDVAWNGSDLLFVSDAFEQVVHAFDLSHNSLGSIGFAQPFVEEGDAITGIARGRQADTLFVYNTTNHRIALTDLAGDLLDVFDAQLPVLSDEDEGDEEEDRGTVLGMTFDPRGNGGQGSLWVVEAVDDSLHELDLSGGLLRTLPHPYRDVVRIPEGAPFGSFSSGISLVEGANPTRLYLTGGTAMENGQERILELDVESNTVVRGSEFPTAGVRKASGGGSITLQHVIDGETSRLFALPIGSRPPMLLEIEPELSPVPPPIFLACRQRGLAEDVELNFQGNGPYDAVAIFRDCELVAELPGDDEHFVDENVPPGVHDYAVQGVLGDRTSASAECRLRVGPGAILERRFAWPNRSPQQIARNPIDGAFYISTNWPGEERRIFRYDAGLHFRDARESSVREPWEIATVAVRPPPEGREGLLYYIAWQQPVPLGQAGRETFLLVSETLAGDFVDEVVISPPRPTNGFVTFPTGLAWDASSDSFYFLERNSKTFVQMAPDGGILRTFPHPSPPFQNFVFNLGVTVVPGGDALLITGSDRADHRVTKILEMGADGGLTGYVLSLREVPGTVRGICHAGTDLIAVANAARPELARLKASPGVPAPFIRGDSNHSGRVEITDALVTLNYLFRGAEAPRCADAADADDSGRLTINDAAVVLRWLFLGGAPLPAPFPAAGQDPTPDGLACD